MIKNILLLIVLIINIGNQLIGQSTSKENTPKIKQINFNKLENSFVWALVNKSDTIRIIKTYDNGSEFRLGESFAKAKKRFITYQLEDFGSGALTTVLYDFIQKKFYSLKYNLTGLENEKLIFSSVNFEKRKICVEVVISGKKKNVIRNLIQLK